MTTYKHPCFGLASKAVRAFDTIIRGNAPQASHDTIELLLALDLVQKRSTVIGAHYVVPPDVLTMWKNWSNEHKREERIKRARPIRQRQSLQLDLWPE